MKRRNGEKIVVRKNQFGYDLMVQRPHYNEYELWDLLDRLANKAGVSRSTYQRMLVKYALIKRTPNIKNISGINWGESEILSNI
jgi:hypothetical protein